MKEGHKANLVLVEAILLSLLTLLPLPASAQGIPFFQNYMREDYQANSINFDIETDNDGIVYLANFEGMMYFDHAQWRMLLTPGITRVTVTVKTNDGTVWVGGYKYFGRVQRKDNGEIYLQRIGKPDLFNSEVSEIYERDGKVRFITRDASIFEVEGDSVKLYKKIDKSALKIGVLDVVDTDAAEKGDADIVRNEVITEEDLAYGMKAVIHKGSGITITDDNGKELYSVTGENGLCSSDVVYFTYDQRGTLWGATSKGLFAMAIPSAFSHFSVDEGLHGSVLSIEHMGNRFYVGTDEGLFYQDGLRFKRVPGITHSCWAMTKSGSGLLVASAEGIYRISPDNKTQHLTTKDALSVFDAGTHFYCGEFDGVYQTSADGRSRKKICQMENVKKMVRGADGAIWMQSIYGTVGAFRPDTEKFEMHKGKGKGEMMHSLVSINGKVELINSETTKPFPYPFFAYTDSKGICWLTNNEGKELYAWKDGKRLDQLNRLVAPFSELLIRAVYTLGDEIWIGSDNGLSIINTKAPDPHLDLKPELHIRSITLGSDSILWGGFGDMTKALNPLKHNEHNIKFTFSLNSTAVIGKNLYRYRLNDGSWSTWSTSCEANFVNLSHGTYTFYVQARDEMNRLSETISIDFTISVPFYMRWYMNLLYLLLTATLIYFITRWRMRKLEKDKERLELIIKDRTAQVVRLEKMATTGKLTQGLIDRILNPLNYINNFSKLSEGLIKDVKANIEDEKDHMDQENYDDTMDVLNMLTGNLQKVSEHGQNTTRTLKAMEEMLKDRSGGIVMMDLTGLVRQNEEMLQTYFKDDIAKYGIKITFDCPDGPLPIDGNPEQLSKTIMSILGNAVYATKKKAQRATDGQYTPEITLRLTTDSKQVLISIHDNGIGIEDTIIDKVFDPFFTTKTTGEASGVGLYLSREIIQNLGGDISVKSVKDEYTEFTIDIPFK